MARTEKAAAVEAAGSGGLVIPAVNIRQMRITVIGDSPLICHRFSAKASQEMLDKQMKKAKQAKAAKDPEQLFKDSLYPVADKPGVYGFPAIAFKAAAVDACTHIDGMKKTFARGAFHIIGDLVEIDGTPTPRQDTVRIGMGTSDIRFRGEFTTWKATFLIRYNSLAIQPEQIVNMVNVGGFSIGVGEWRPQRDGSMGMFHVDGVEA